MASLSIDLNNVPNDLNTFPNGNYLAEVIKAEMGVTQKGDPTLNLRYRIHHPNYGMTELRDGLPSSFPSKIKTFYTSFHHIDPQEAGSLGEIEIEENELIGGTIIIALGERQGNNKEGVSVTYKQVVSPFYYPDDRDDVLLDTEAL